MSRLSPGFDDTLISSRADGSPRQPADVLVNSLATDAATFVVGEISRLYSGEGVFSGAVGRSQTREDLARHVEFLVAALATGSQEFFSDYIVWLTLALKSRGAPPGVLDEALRLLETFYRRTLDARSGQMVAAVLSGGRAAITTADARGWAIEDADGAEKPPHVEALVRCLIDGDIAGAQASGNAFWRDRNDYIEIATGLFQPALYEVGSLWQSNAISVDQERLATAICKTLLTVFYRKSFPAPDVCGRSALFATVAGNQHGVGVQVVADAFRLAGWSVELHENNTTTTDFLATIDRSRPELIGLSTALVEHLPRLRRVVDEIKGEFGARGPTIVVGGLPTNRFERAWRWVGADAWAPDAKQAVKELG